MSSPHYYDSIHTSLYPSLYSGSSPGGGTRRSNPHEMGFNNDHLEEFDSQLGDVEAGSRGATQATGSTTIQDDSQYDLEESIKRGVMNAKAAERNQSSRTPGQFMEDLVNNGAGYSVTTGQMDQMLQDDSPYDTYTFDGSTITSSNDITHKKFAPQQAVVHFPQHDPTNRQGMQTTAVYPNLKLMPTQSTENTSYSSSKPSGRSEQSRAEKICCGLGKLGVILISVAVILVSIAFILWLVLGLIPSQDTGASSSSSSACCRGDFQPGMAGREICSASNVCCVVCANSIVSSNALETAQQQNDKPNKTPPSKDQETQTRQPSEAPSVAPTTATPTQTPSLAPSLAPTLAPTTAAPTTAKPTMAPTRPCCTDDQWGDFIGLPRCSDTDPNDCCIVCAP